jgi:lipoprotein-anchoring transpeptidase ErfK/SrfK
MRAAAAAATAALLTAALTSCGANTAPTTTSTLGPEATGPKAAEPKATEPKTAGPKAAGPKATGPKPAGPKVAGPEAAIEPAPSGDGASGQPVAQVVRDTRLRTAPGGRVLGRVGPRTRFGVTTYLPVVRRRAGWLGVIAAEAPNNTVAWLPAAATRPAVSRTRLVVDLAKRRLRVLAPDGRTLLRMTVGIGAPATPTPTGRFAVTDGLRAAPGSPYGCCILALSGHEPHVPQGWAGGDRLAIHGTTAPTTIGAAASLGCLHATDADLRRLMRLVTLGSIVEIRA